MKPNRIAVLALAVAAFSTAALAPAGAQSDKVYEHTVTLHEFEGGAMHAFPEQIYAKKGDTLRITVVNPPENEISHNLIVCGEPPHPESTCKDKWAFTPTFPPGESRTITFEAKEAGTFEYFCDIVGHKQATPGMVGQLIVQGGETTNESPGLALVGALVAVAGAALLLRRR